MDYKNIKIENYSLQKGNKILFQDTDLVVNYQTKYGLIGKNGVGKSSLMEYINERDPQYISPYLDLLYIHQEIEVTENTILDEILKQNKEREMLLEQNKQLLEKLDLSERDDTIFIQELQDNIDSLESINYERDEPLVKKILSGLGFLASDFDKKVSSFSGGWRMRINLAKALYLEPSLLILDEPTNHLDLEAVIWLEDYLTKWKKTLIIISHNINFLNEICDYIINCENQKLNYYKGNYYKFVSMYEKEIIKVEKDYLLYTKKIKKLQKGNNTKSQVQEFIKKNIKPLPPLKKEIPYLFPDLEKLSENTLITLNNVNFDYQDSNLDTFDYQDSNLDTDFLFQNLNLTITLDDRRAIVGRNGSGKSTFLKLLKEDLLPNSGYISRISNLRIGYYHQHFSDILPKSINSIEYLSSLNSDLETEEIRKYLGTFQIEGKAHLIPIENLSGGQKARLLLISLLLENPHILLLDEPTNHLDINIIEWLIKAINNYKGAVYIVSHDEELITSINCSIFCCDNNNISKFSDNYQDYKDYILETS